MAVSTIDGTLEEAVMKRSYARVISYERLRFRLAGGGEEVVTKIVAEKASPSNSSPGRGGVSICSRSSITRASAGCAIGRAAPGSPSSRAPRMAC